MQAIVIECVQKNKMQGSLLFELFQSLNKKELRDLKKFVRSPFHNKREDVISLYDFLARRWPLSDANKYTKEYVYKQIQPGKAFDRKDFYYLCSFLKKLIEDYLLYRQLEESQTERAMKLSQSYRQKGLARHFNEVAHTVEKLQEKDTLRNSNYHFQRYRLYHEKFQMTTTRSRTEAGDLKEAISQLDLFYLSEQLRLNYGALGIRNMAKFELEEGFFPNSLQYIERKNLQHSIPAIEVYYHYYHVFSDTGGEVDLEQLKALVSKYLGVFSREEMLEIYFMPINFCIRQINLGHRAYLREAFSLYQEGVEYGIFLNNNNVLSRFTYSNIIMIGLVLKEFTWIEQFIHGYKKHLRQPYQEHFYNFNLANFYFQKNEYAKAMNLLLSVEFEDPYYQLEVRRMLIKIYYAQQENTALFSLLESFKRFIYRQKELGYHKERYLNLIRFIHRMVSLEPANRVAMEKLREEIEETPKVADKKWLLEQLA